MQNSNLDTSHDSTKHWYNFNKAATAADIYGKIDILLSLVLEDKNIRKKMKKNNYFKYYPWKMNKKINFVREPHIV